MSSYPESADERLVLFTSANRSNDADTPSSLTLLTDRVKKLLEKPHLLSHKKEFVVKGGWKFSTDDMETLQIMYRQLDLEDAVDTDADEPLHSPDLTRARSQSSAAQKATPKKHEMEWSLAINLIKSILGTIDGLNTLEWETDLPLFKDIWTVIPKNIQSLSLNVFVPKPEDLHEYDPHPEYFARDDLLYLTNFKNLSRLRIYNMPESFQAVIWETVWKNPNLKTLELGMRYEVVTRDPEDNKATKPATDGNWKYDPTREPANKYIGSEGNGFLQYAYGYGEYLDRVAISKARNAAMSEMRCSLGDLKAMPLTTLRLDKFVVDDTAFVNYFDNLEKLVLTHTCADAGLVLPKNLQDQVAIYTRASPVGEIAEGSEAEVLAETAG